MAIYLRASTASRGVPVRRCSVSRKPAARSSASYSAGERSRPSVQISMFNDCMLVGTGPTPSSWSRRSAMSRAPPVGRRSWTRGLGLPAVIVASMQISKMLFHVDARDPFTLAGAALALAAVGALAGFVPALRASRVDPLVALRHE